MSIENFSDIKIFAGFSHVLMEVGVALLPLIGFFVFFQLFILKLPTQKFFNILKGLIPTFLGLALFLQGGKGWFFPGRHRDGRGACRA